MEEVWNNYTNPKNKNLLKANNNNNKKKKNSRKRCEIYSELTKKLERRHWRRSGVFTVNFEHISHIFLVFLLLDFEQVNVCWEDTK